MKTFQAAAVLKYINFDNIVMCMKLEDMKASLQYDYYPLRHYTPEEIIKCAMDELSKITNEPQVFRGFILFREDDDFSILFWTDSIYVFNIKMGAALNV